MDPQHAPILIDVDNVLADFTTMYLRLVRSRIGRELPEDFVVDCWDHARACGLTPEEEAEVDAALAIRGLARMMDPLPGAVEGVKALLAEGLEVHFVTAPFLKSPTWDHDRRTWLLEHFGDVGKRVTFTHDKYLVDGLLLIDDNPRNCFEYVSYTAARAERAAIMWAQPHNKNEKLRDRVTRLNTWEAVLGAVLHRVCGYRSEFSRHAEEATEAST